MSKFGPVEGDNVWKFGKNQDGTFQVASTTVTGSEIERLYQLFDRSGQLAYATDVTASVQGGERTAAAINGAAVPIDLDSSTTASVIGSGGSVVGGDWISLTLDASNIDVNLGSGAAINVGGGLGGITITTSASFIAAGNQTSLILNGNQDAIAAGIGSATGVFGNADILAQTGGAASFTGSGDRGLINGVSFAEGSNTSATLEGDQNVISAGTNDITGVLGNDDTVNQSGGLVIVTGARDTGNIDGATVAEGAQTSLTVNGSNDGITAGGPNDATGVFGNNDTLAQTGGAASFTGSNDTGYLQGVSFAEGNGTSATLVGDDNTIGAEAHDQTGVIGNGNTVGQTGGVVNFAGSGNVGNISDAAVGEAANSSVVVNGQDNSIGVNGGDSLVLSQGGGDVVSGVGAGDHIEVAGTGGNADVIYSVGDYTGGNAANGAATGIFLDANADAVVDGSANGIVLSTSNTLVASQGGGDIIGDVGAGDHVEIAGTGSNADVVNSVGDYTGGNAASGAATGVFLDANADAVVNGSANGIVLSSSNTLVASQGGGDSIDNVGAGDHVEIAGTGTNADTVYSEGNYTGGNAASGAATGIFLDAGAYAAIQGDGNTVVGSTGNTASFNGAGNTGDLSGATIIEAANSSLNVGGSADTIDAAANDSTGVFGNSDVLNANGGSASFTGTNDLGNLNGALVAEGAGTSVSIVGNDDLVNAGSDDNTGIVGNRDTLNASGGTASFEGTSDQGNLNATTVAEGQNTSVNILGSGNIINAGSSDSTGVFGSYDTVNEAGGSVSFTGTNDWASVSNGSIAEGSNTSLTVAGSGNTIHAGSDDSTGVFGDYNNLHASGGSASFTGSHDSGFVDHTSVAVGDGTSVNLEGSNDNVALSAGDTLGLGGSSDTVNAGANDTTNIKGNSDTYNGSSGTVGVVGNGEVVNASNETVAFGSNTTATGHDSYDRIDDYSSGVISLTGSYDTQYDQGGDTAFLSGFYDATATLGSIGDPEFDPCPDGDDPLILNLGGGPVTTTGLSESNTFFDMQNSGTSVLTGWMTRGEGLLVYDPGPTDVVKNDAALVGGYQALDGLAGRSTGALTAADALWGELKVWTDASGTGAFKAEDLYSLPALGISSIGLAGESVDEPSNGNTIVAVGQFTFGSGATGAIAGVDLMFDPTKVAPGGT